MLCKWSSEPGCSEPAGLRAYPKAPGYIALYTNPVADSALVRNGHSVHPRGSAARNLFCHFSQQWAAVERVNRRRTSLNPHTAVIRRGPRDPDTETLTGA